MVNNYQWKTDNFGAFFKSLQSIRKLKIHYQNLVKGKKLLLIMEQVLFWIILYHREHHWKGISQFHDIRWNKLSYIMTFLNITIFWNFIIIKVWWNCSFLQSFLWNFYFVYLLRAALCRLILELSQELCSINWVLKLKIKKNCMKQMRHMFYFLCHNFGEIKKIRKVLKVGFVTFLIQCQNW
jgi:hypothetical protein